MNNEKIILEILDNNNEIIIKIYKSVLQVSKDYPKIPYYSLRTVYLNHKKQLTNKTENTNKVIKHNFRIYDNPEFLDMLIIS